VVVPVRAEPLEVTIPAGALLRDALAAAVAADGFDGAVFGLAGAAFAPFAYVMPALSPDGRTAAWYSATHSPRGVTVLDAGALTLGRRDGADFFHGHGTWRAGSGAVSGGHLLPEVCTLAAETVLRGVGLRGARFEAVPDPETGFTLFAPVATDAGPSEPNALALRLRPNQDLTLALEALAARHGLGRARLCGGVGSTIGVRWADGTGADVGFATELAVTQGVIDPAGDSAVAAVLVDVDGRVSRGRLARGDNPVLMTLEAVLVGIGPADP
jgi:predicted DNA-binding protein with PD1-like motif